MTHTNSRNLQINKEENYLCLELPLKSYLFLLTDFAKDWELWRYSITKWCDRRFFSSDFLFANSFFYCDNKTLIMRSKTMSVSLSL